MWAAEIHIEEYYLNMMRAWYFATALAKQPDAALPWLTERRLDVWTHNKTIQKDNRPPAKKQTVCLYHSLRFLQQTALLQLIHQDDRVIHRPHGTHDRVVTGHAADDLMESDHIERLSDRHRHTGNGLDHENILCHIHGDIAVTEDADVFFSEILLMLHDCVTLASVFPRYFCEL